MDVSTIKEKLDKQIYLNPAEYAADFLLMLDNCYMYNPPNHSVVLMGKQLEKFFKDKFAAIPEDQLLVPLLKLNSE